MPEPAAATPLLAILVDDEPWALANLRVLLARDPAVVVIAECGNGRQAVEDVRRHRPDLLFLDVQMPECDGFEVLERLGPLTPPGLVFVTAHDAYALKAFDAAAVDYLLKPFERERFERALRLAKERALQRRRQPAVRAPWVVRNGPEILLVDPADIDWIEASDYYACLRVGERRHLLRRSLAELAQTLEGEAGGVPFCRIHRSVIVNLQRVERIGHDAGGGGVVVLRDGRTLPLSRRLAPQVRARLAGGVGEP